MVSVGQKLHDARISRGLSIEDVASATKIRASFISAIENGDFKKLPSSAYATGFVRNYSVFLGLPPKEMVALFRREFDEKKTYDVLPKGLTKTDFTTRGFNLSGGIILAIIIFAVLLLYIGIEYRYAFINPPLNIYSPKENQKFNSSDISVYGKTDPNATVFINDTPVSVGKDGSFKKTVSLFSGAETISIKAVNSFGKKTEDTIHVEINN